MRRADWGFRIPPPVCYLPSNLPYRAQPPVVQPNTRATWEVLCAVFSGGGLPRGAWPNRGPTLFVIDPRPYRAEYDRTLADVAKAQAQVEQTTAELTRIENLRPGGAVTEKELFDARYNKKAADAALASAQANARTAELNLD